MENIKVTARRIPLMDHDRVEIEFKSPEFLFIQTSPLFKNAVSNLIENAFKYTGEDNKVHILVEKDHLIKIHIIDSGKGIPDEEKEKILEKFYRRQSDTKIEGSGRGLWITNNIIHQEGGTLSISDNPEGGTVFTISIQPYIVEDFEEMLKKLTHWFEIPLERVKNKADTYRSLYELQGRKDIDHMDSAVFTTILTVIRKERKEEKEAFVSARLENLKNKNPTGKSVIIVDDSLYVQFYLAKYFNELGFNIIDYQDNGESAVISYSKRLPDYITLDNNMNVKTGPEAAVEIYSQYPDAKIIFITALGDSVVFRKNLTERLPSENYRIMSKPVYKKDIKTLMEEF
jgi:CheY-like chemotaxis protein